MRALIAKRDTFLKTHPLDFCLSDLPEDIRSIPIGEGQKVIYSQIEEKGNYFLIGVAPPIEGRSGWYAFTNHFDISVVP